MFDHHTLAKLVPLFPLCGAALVGIIGIRGLRDKSHWLVLLGVGLALAAAIRLTYFTNAVASRSDAACIRNAASSFHLFEWIQVDAENAATVRTQSQQSHVTAVNHDKWLNVTFRVDPLTCMMLLTVLGVSFLVVTYSVGYMRDHHGHAEVGYERFFAFLGIFVFSMCTLVLAGNFLVLYVGWELVGLSSYLLIGFYYQRPSAAAAAKKAFLV